MDKLLSAHQIASITGWSPLTVYRKSANGEIPGRVCLGKRSIRFRESAIEEWLGLSAPQQEPSGHQPAK